MQKNFPLSGSVLAICISFVIDNIDKISHVSRDFLSSSNLACCYILTVYKRQPLLNATITPLLTQSPSLIEPSIKTLIKLHNIVISRARAVGIKISNPRKVPLEELIHQIQACNFNLFFKTLLNHPIFEKQKPDIEKKLQSTDKPLEKAALGRQWMQDNQELLKGVTAFNSGHLSLSSVPPEIGLLTELEELYLNDNNLTFLPTEVGSLTNLLSLSLVNNQFTSLPSVISSLTNLKELFLDENQLTFLPPQISSLTNLISLSLASNQFTSLPSVISSLTNLKELFLDDNQLTSTSLEVICPLIRLRSLNLAQNQLTHLPEGFRWLINLKKIWLSENCLDPSQPVINYLKKQLKLHLLEL